MMPSDAAQPSTSQGVQLDPPIEHLFDLDRFPTETYKLALLIIYAPFGFLIFIVRFCIALNAFVASCILPKTSIARCCVLRLMSLLCGVVVRESGNEHDRQCSVIVANHVSPLDHAAICLLRPCTVPNVWNVPALLSWAFGYTSMGAHSGRQTLVDNAKLYCQKSRVPLLTLPETAMTNGRAALLSFANWPFALETAIQPCVVRVHRPIVGDISVTRLGSRWWTDVLYFLFVPYTVINVDWLPRFECVNMTPTMAAQCCAKLMATSLSLSTSRYTSRDAVEYAKRVVLDRRLDESREREDRQQRVHAQAARRVANNSLSKPRSDADLDLMTYKVKELCPMVPLYTIRIDIERTRSVALTVDRFSSDSTTFTPITSLDQVERVYRLLQSSHSASKPSQFTIRKWLTIEHNRMSYMGKHSM